MAWRSGGGGLFGRRQVEGPLPALAGTVRQQRCEARRGDATRESCGVAAALAAGGWWLVAKMLGEDARGMDACPSEADGHTDTAPWHHVGAA